MGFAPFLREGSIWGSAIKDIGSRWSRRAPAALAVAVLALVPLQPGAGADSESTFVVGSGRARASLFEIAPRTGGLAIPVNFGKALVTYQGLSATATSGALKPPEQEAADGDCGTKTPGGDGGGGGPQPPGLGGGSGPPTSFPFVSTLTVSTGEEGAEKGRSMDQGSFPEGSPISGAFQHQFVAADAAPSGRAVSTGGRLAFGPLVEVVNGRTEAHAGVAENKTRVASAVTTMDQLRLLDGLIVLGDVRWEATQRTGEGAGADGRFAVGSVLFQGKPLPAPPAPPAALPGAPAPVLPDPLAALNTALAPTGLVIEAPRFAADGEVARVSPLSLRFTDSPLGAAVLAPLVTSLQPLRDPLVNALLAYSCDFGIAVTVADVATGVLTGTGGISFDFGGVTATTEGEQYDNPLAGGFGDEAGFNDGADLGDALPELAPIPSTAFSGPGYGGALPADVPADLGGSVGDIGGNTGVRTPRPQPRAADGNDEEIALDDTGGLFGSTSRRVPGQKGGRAVAVAGIALLTVAALAAADAFHLRRASRSIS
jgi:hypothetical protein